MLGADAGGTWRLIKLWSLISKCEQKQILFDTETRQNEMTCAVKFKSQTS